MFWILASVSLLLAFPVRVRAFEHPGIVVLSLVPCAADATAVPHYTITGTRHDVVPGRAGLQWITLSPIRQQRLARGKWRITLSEGYYYLRAVTPHCHLHWHFVVLAGHLRHLVFRLRDGKNPPNFLEENWYSAAGRLPTNVVHIELRADGLGRNQPHWKTAIEDHAWYADLISNQRFAIQLFGTNGSRLGSVRLEPASTAFGGYRIRDISAGDVRRASLEHQR